MQTMNTLIRKLVPFCIALMLLISCGAGIGSVAAQSNGDYLGDIYLNALYENIGTLPIAGNENGWTNIKTGKSLSFTPEGGNLYYIADSAKSAATTNLPGTYTKTIDGTKYQIDVKYPSVTVSGYMYLPRDLSHPIGSLIGGTPSTDYCIKLSVPATLEKSANVTGIALTNPDNSLTQILGKKNGNVIEFSDSLAEYDPGTWTVTPVFKSGHENGFSNLAPSYMYGDAVSFTVRKADHTISLEVSKTTTPVPTPTATAKPTAATSSPTQAPLTNTTVVENISNGSITEPTPEIPTLQSPVPLAGLIAGLGAAAVLLRRKE